MSSNVAVDAVDAVCSGVDPGTGVRWREIFDVHSVAQMQEVLWSMVRVFFGEENNWHELGIMNDGPWPVAVPGYLMTAHDIPMATGRPPTSREKGDITEFLETEASY